MKDFKFKVGDVFTGREGIGLAKSYRMPNKFIVTGIVEHAGFPYQCESLGPRGFNTDWRDDEMMRIPGGNDGF